MLLSDVLAEPSDPIRRLERVSTILIVATTVVVLIWVALTSMELAYASLVPSLAACTLAAFIGIFYRTLRPDQTLSNTTVALAQLIAFPVMALPLSYLAASLGRPLADPMFHRWDQALGLDWLGYLHFVHAHPGFGRILSHAYDSLIVQMVLVVAALGLTGRGYQLQRFLVAYMISSLLSIVISAVLPAIAIFPYLGLRLEDYPDLALLAARGHLPDLEALRAGTLKIISLKTAEGIITFPSMHAALGLLFLVAFWSIPLLRWPAFIVNLLMIAATPIDGSHYFVDVFAGIALALLALAAADALAFPRRRIGSEAVGSHVT